MSPLDPAGTDLAVPVADTLSIGGSVAAPGLGVLFVSLAAPPAGVYRIEITFVITGAVETNALNVRLQYNGSGKGDFASGAGVAAILTYVIERATLDGASVVKLTTVAAATAATVYTGTISATRIG